MPFGSGRSLSRCFDALQYFGSRPVGLYRRLGCQRNPVAAARTGVIGTIRKQSFTRREADFVPGPEDRVAHAIRNIDGLFEGGWLDSQ